MEKIILHLDMNSYFASCEQQANPHLRGRPVGVCEHLGGIIIASSVEAKRLGIKLGTTVWDARKIYPKIVLLPVDPDKYRHITASFLRILHDYTDKVERYSIDEAFMDITELAGNNPSQPPLTLRGGEKGKPPLQVRGGEGELFHTVWDNALLLGLEIKQRLRLEIGEWVSCSIGIGPNRLLSKIAADLDGGAVIHNSSPPPLILRGGVPSLKLREGEGELLDRICVIRPEDIPMLYGRLKLTDVPGVGPRLERALHKLGIFSLRQMRDYPLANLINQFGINGYFLHELANFHNSPQPPLILRGGEGELSPAEEIKSFGHSYTLPKTINKLSDIKKLTLKLSEKIGRRMRRKGARGNIVHYFHSDKQYEGLSRQHKIKEFINDGRDIYKAAFGIFTSSRFHSNNINVKIIGVSVSGLVFGKPEEPLFEQYKKPRWVVEAMDKINNKYGEFTIQRGRLLGIPEEWGKDTVGFGRMKEFTLSNAAEGSNR